MRPEQTELEVQPDILNRCLDAGEPPAKAAIAEFLGHEPGVAMKAGPLEVEIVDGKVWRIEIVHSTKHIDLTVENADEAEAADAFVMVDHDGIARRVIIIGWTLGTTFRAKGSMHDYPNGDSLWRLPRWKLRDIHELQALAKPVQSSVR